MSKISYKELAKQLKVCKIALNYDNIGTTPNFCVYHYHEWDHGYNSWDGSYGQYVFYEGPRRQFYADMREMWSFLMDYFSISGIEDVIVAPCYRYHQFDERYYHVKGMSGVDIFEEIRKFLKRNGIRKGERSGIRVPIRENINVIEMIIEGAFRGVSNFCLFSFERQVLIEPTHHLDLIFWTQEFDKEKKVVNSLLPKHPNLKYFDADTQANLM